MVGSWQPKGLALAANVIREDNMTLQITQQPRIGLRDRDVRLTPQRWRLLLMGSERLLKSCGEGKVS